MSEATFWARTRDAIGPFGRLRRIENIVEKGTPDVAYLLRRYPKVAPVSGWIEMKFLSKWPKRAASPVVIEKLKREQVDWLLDWHEAGGRAWCLLQAERTVLLLDPPTVARLYARDLNRVGLLGAASVAAIGSFPTPGILKCLTAT